MRWATLVMLTLLATGPACNDLRDFRGTWQGPRVGEAEVLRVGAGESATLSIDEIDSHGIQGHLAIPGLVPDAALVPVPGAEADALANMTFSGGPLRVYLAFVPMPDGGGDALVLVALFDDARVELRVLRSGTQPVYAIFAMTST